MVICLQVHTTEPLVHGPIPLEVEIAVVKLKSIDRQVVIKFWQNQFKQEVNYYCLRSINSLILFGIRKNCLISRRRLLLYQFIKRVIKLIVVIIVGYHCYELPLKVKSIYK
jgi:hypothetical protein